LTSLRRVKKGPGRRPQSAKRQQFMELRARGWSVRAAAREVGVSRTSGANWARGHKIYRNGVVVGFVASLDPLAVRQISSRYLTQDERIEIADLRQSGLSLRVIAVRLGRGRCRRSRESCDATRWPAAGIAPSTPIVAPRSGEHVGTGVGSKPTASFVMWSPSCFFDGGAAVTCATAFPTIRRCGCAMRASIKLFINRIRVSCGPRRWRRIDAHRYAPVVTTAERTSASSAVGPGFSSRCSPSMIGRSQLLTDLKPDTGKAI